jgi:GTPase
MSPTSYQLLYPAMCSKNKENFRKFALPNSMEKTKNPFRSGFVNILGKPNVGKSTLLNRLVGQSLAITTPKAQTTRDRILGILNGKDYQIIFSDTPGLIDPAYALQEWMMKEAKSALEDADLILFMVPYPFPKSYDELALLKRSDCPKFLLINKIDLLKEGEIEIPEELQFEKWEEIFHISALNGNGTKALLDKIKSLLPEHPAYFGDDQLTDKSERFIAAETIRKPIFNLFKQEVPYSVQVEIEYFHDEPRLLSIGALIIVERNTQKGIIIGKGGSKLKEVGTLARKEMEKFFGKKVFLETHVKVEKEWRKTDSKLRKLGFK